MESRSRPAYVSTVGSASRLISAKQTEDLGVIPTGFQQAIAFPVSNPSDSCLKLAVVHSSCSCLDATIDQSDLAARASTTVRAKVHAADTLTPGPLAAEVRIAASGTGGEKFALTLGIRGVVEGLKMERAVVRVPQAIVGWSPLPLRGVFYSGKTSDEGELTDLEWSTAGVASGLAIGEPTLSALQDRGDHAVRHLNVPLRVDTSHRPMAGVYEVAVNYRLRGVESRTTFVLQVIDALE